MTVEEALAILDAALKQGHLTNLQEQVFRYCWEGKTYAEIANLTGYDHDYIRDVGFRLWQLLSKTLGRKVTKSNAQSALRSYAQQVQSTASQVPAAPAEPVTPTHYQDWGDALDVSNFYGRSQELDTLEQWIVRDRCRVVGLFGIGGVGKTFLSVKLGENLQDQFEFVIWRSLRNAPPVQELIATTIRFLSQQQEITLPESLDGQISRLLHYLRQHRCLLIMDNGESILQPEDHLGRYREGYEGYGQVLRAIGETRHQSCLVMTGREKSQGFSALEGEDLPVRSLQLGGLSQAEGQQILKSKGLLGSEQDYRQLVQYYRGNPLALKITAASIRDLFGGSIPQFLEQGTGVFNGIRDLLQQQMQRLSVLEAQVMIWLAINREPVSPADLQADLVPAASRPQLLEALESLLRRSLIEQTATGFTQQPVVMEYMTEQLLEQVQTEITAEQFQQLQQYALIKALAKDYVRESQTRVILEPLVERLRLTLGSDQAIVAKLQRIIVKLQQNAGPVYGYGGGNIVNLLRHLKVDLTSYNFSHLALWQAYLQDLTLHDVNLTGADLTKAVFAETLGIVLTVVFCPNGNLLASADANGEIRIWQSTSNYRQLLAWKGHSRWIHTLSFSPNAQMLVSGAIDPEVKVWDVTTGECLRTLSGFKGSVWAVAFSPNSQLVAGAGLDRTIKIWSVQTGECLQTLHGHTSCIWSVVFTPSGDSLISGSDDRTIKVWSLSTGECEQTFHGHTGTIWSTAVSPDGQKIASSSEDHTVKIWDIQTGNCLETLHAHRGNVAEVAFNPDGTMLASCGDDQIINLWRGQNYQHCSKMLGHTHRIWSIAFSPDARTLASGGSDQAVKLWDLSTGSSFKTLKGFTDVIQSVAFNPKDSVLASASDNRTVNVWDPQTGKCLKTFKAHDHRVLSVTFSLDGQMLATSSDDFKVKLWEASTGELLHVCLGHQHQVRSVAFSPNGQLLASGSSDQTAKLWNVRTGECLRTLTGHSGWVLPTVFSPDGQVLASGSSDQTVRLWEVATGKCIQTFEGHTSAVLAIIYSQEGHLLATGSGDGKIGLWDVKTGQCLKMFQGHTNIVWSVLFCQHSSGSVLISGSSDQIIKMWDIETGECLQVFQGHERGVLSIALSPEQSILASGSEDETIRLWNLATGECLKTLRAPRPYEGMKIIDAFGLNEAQKTSLQTLGAVI